MPLSLESLSNVFLLSNIPDEERKPLGKTPSEEEMWQEEREAGEFKLCGGAKGSPSQVCGCLNPRRAPASIYSLCQWKEWNVAAADSLACCFFFFLLLSLPHYCSLISF